MSKRGSYKINNPKTKANYISSIVSLTIMLYLLGIWGLVAIYANQVINFSKENIPFYVELKDDANQALVFSFQKKLEASAFAKPQTVEYISKEDALKALEGNDEVLKQEEVMLFGDNLLPNMIRFCIQNKYFAQYEKIVEEIKANDFVNHVFFTQAPVEYLALRVYRIEIILLVLMVFFIFVVITLIKNTLKLILLSNKDSVKTMQLVGSTLDYMGKPYISQSLKNGLLSAVVAVACIWGTRYLLGELVMVLPSTVNMWVSILSIVVLLAGLLLSWLCTRQSIRKFLAIPVEEW